MVGVRATAARHSAAARGQFAARASTCAISGWSTVGPRAVRALLTARRASSSRPNASSARTSSRCARGAHLDLAHGDADRVDGQGASHQRQNRVALAELRVHALGAQQRGRVDRVARQHGAERRDGIGPAALALEVERAGEDVLAVDMGQRPRGQEAK
jgi:hypothetical protein